MLSFSGLYLFLSPRITKRGKTATPRAWRLTHAIRTSKSTATPHHLDRFLPTKECNSHVNRCTPTAITARFNEVRVHTKKVYTTCTCIVTNALILETKTPKACIQTWAQHSYTCSYQQFSSRAFLEIATHRHLPSKMDGSHALVLTCEYATRTSNTCIRNSLLCWTQRPSSSLS